MNLKCSVKPVLEICFCFIGSFALSTIVKIQSLSKPKFPVLNYRYTQVSKPNDVIISIIILCMNSNCGIRLGSLCLFPNTRGSVHGGLHFFDLLEV